MRQRRVIPTWEVTCSFSKLSARQLPALTGSLVAGVLAPGPLRPLDISSLSGLHRPDARLSIFIPWEGARSRVVKGSKGTTARDLLDLFLATCMEHGSSKQPPTVSEKTARWHAEPWKAAASSSRASLTHQRCRVPDGGHGTGWLLPLSGLQEIVSGPKSGIE